MKSLLAIINEPEKSKGFIRYVASLAADLKLRVHLLFVQSPSNYLRESIDYIGPETHEAQQNLRSQVDQANNYLIGHIKEISREVPDYVSFDHTSKIGDTSSIVNDMKTNNKIDMVVLEGQEKTSLWAQTISAMEIIQNVVCPAWIIPYGAVYKPYTKILYATDYKEEDIQTLTRLISLTKNYSPDITALHVTDNLDFEIRVKKAGFVEMLKENTKYGPISIKNLVNNDQKALAELIVEYALQIKVDLIVILKENKSFLERMFIIDPAKEILEYTNLPVLIFHEKNSTK